MKKRLCIILVLLLILSLTACGPSEEEILDGKTELIGAINDAVSSGTSEMDFYVSGVNEKDIENINESLNGFWGSCSEYLIEYEEDGVIGGTLYFELSDNYYVYDNYVNSSEIPKKRKHAIAVAEVIPDVVSAVEKDTEQETELALHDYLVLKADYDETMDVESELNSAYGALVEGTTMCNGYADAMSLILECLDIDVKVVVGEADGESHAWNLVELEDEWYHVDATWDDMDDEDLLFHGYYNMNDSEISMTHEWEKELYPKAEGENNKYYKDNGLFFESYDAFKQGVGELLGLSPSFIEAMVTDFNDDTYDYQFIFNTVTAEEIFYFEEPVGSNTVILLDL